MTEADLKKRIEALHDECSAIYEEILEESGRGWKTDRAYVGILQHRLNIMEVVLDGYEEQLAAKEAEFWGFPTSPQTSGSGSFHTPHHETNKLKIRDAWNRHQENCEAIGKKPCTDSFLRVECEALESWADDGITEDDLIKFVQNIS